MIETELRTYILGDSAITDVIGNRYYVDRMVDNPGESFIRADLIASGNLQMRHDGKLEEALWQLNVYHHTLSSLHGLVASIKNRCEQKSIGLGDFTVLMDVVGIRSDWDEKSRYFIRKLDIEVKYGKDQS